MSGPLRMRHYKRHGRPATRLFVSVQISAWQFYPRAGILWVEGAGYRRRLDINRLEQRIIAFDGLVFCVGKKRSCTAIRLRSIARPVDRRNTIGTRCFA